MPGTLITGGSSEDRVTFRPIKNGFIKETSRVVKGKKGEPGDFQREEEFLSELPEGVSVG